MKKYMLSFITLIAISMSSFANSMTIINTTPCFYYASTQAGYIWITPAGTSGANQFYPTGNYFAAKIMRDNIAAYGIGVGSNPPAVPFFNQLIYSSAVGDYPACNGGNMYKITWNVDAAGDVTLSID